MKNPDPWRIKPATFLTLVQCFNQLHHRVPPERIVVVPTTRVSKTLFLGTVNYSRIFAFFARGLELTRAKSQGRVYVSGAVALLLECLLGHETFGMEKRTFLVKVKQKR